MTQKPLFDLGKPKLAPMRKSVKCLYETLSKHGSRAFKYRLDCGHTITRLGSDRNTSGRYRCNDCLKEGRL